MIWERGYEREICGTSSFWDLSAGKGKRRKFKSILLVKVCIIGILIEKGIGGLMHGNTALEGVIRTIWACGR